MINYIYIWWFRLFWRNYRPNTALVPTWYKRHVKIEKKIWESKEKTYISCIFRSIRYNVTNDGSQGVSVITARIMRHIIKKSGPQAKSD